MQRHHRTALRILLVLGVLAVGLPLAAYLAFNLYDVNRLKPRIEKAASAQTGRIVTLHGELSFTPGWVPTVRAEQITLSNPEWAKEPEFASVGAAEVTFELLPLIDGTLVINDIHVKDAELHFEQGKAGQQSWRFEPEKDAEQETEQAEKESGFRVEPSITAVRLENTTLYYRQGKELVATLALPSARLNLAGEPSLQASYLYEGITGDLNLSAESMENFLQKGASATFAAAFPKEGGTVSFQGRLVSPLKNPGVQGTLEARAKSLSILRPVLPGAPESEAFTLTAKGAANAKNISFSSFRLGLLPEGPVTGKGEVTLKGPRPRITGEVTLPPFIREKSDVPVAGPGTAEGAVTSRLIPDTPLPVDWIKAMDGHLAITMPRFQSGDVALEQIQANAMLEGGRLTLAPLNFQSFEGNTRAELRVDANPSPPRFSLKGEGRDWLLERLIRQPDDGGGKLQGGRTQLTFDLGGQGESLRPVIASMNGVAAFHLADLRYRSPAAAAALTDFIQLLRGKAGGDIRVKCALGKFDIAQGVATTRTLGLNTSGAIVTGTGSIDLGEERINLVLSPRAKVAGLADLAVPVQFAGSLQNPNVRLEPGGTALKVGQVALGIASGGSTLGLALLGKNLTDKLGVTADRDPCADQDQPARASTPAADPATAAPAAGNPAP